MSKTFLFQAIKFTQTIHFSISMLSGAITPGQSGPGSNGNEGVLRIPQSSSTAGNSPSDCLVSYRGHSLGGGSYPSAEVQSVYSTAPADWAFFVGVVCSIMLETILCHHFLFCSGDNFGQLSISSSFSCYVEYWVWNAHTILRILSHNATLLGYTSHLVKSLSDWFI